MVQNIPINEKKNANPIPQPMAYASFSVVAEMPDSYLYPILASVIARTNPGSNTDPENSTVVYLLPFIPNKKPIIRLLLSV